MTQLLVGGENQCILEKNWSSLSHS